jgi:hypothetical protein
MNPFTHKTIIQWQYWIHTAVSSFAVDALLENGTAVISAVLSLDEHLSQTNTCCAPKFCYHSVLLCRDARCWMLHEQQETISMRSNIRGWTHVLFVNMPCSHMHRFCATGVSSGLGTKVGSTRVSRGRLGESITRGRACFWSHFCTVVRDSCKVAF